MYYHLLKLNLTALFFCMSFVEAAEIITIVNDSNQPINISQTIPEHTAATIHLKKLSKRDLQNELLKAIMQDSAVNIKLAVQSGADVNQEIAGQKPIITAVSSSKMKALKALIECGADYTIYCKVPPYGSVYNGLMEWALHAYMNPKDDVLKVLLDSGVLKTTILSHKDIETIVWHKNTLKLFLSYGLDPYMQVNGPNGIVTPLSLALKNGHSEKIELLLQYT